MGSYRDIFKSIMTSSLISVGVTFLLGLMGLLLMLYYRQHPDLAATLEKPDQIVPHFVVNTLPAGVRGLILAAIIAETMSSLSAGFNSFATVGIMDLYKRYFEPGEANEVRDLRIAKLGTLLCGLVSTLAALWISTLKTDILQSLVWLASMFVGPITGIFLLGLLTKRGNLAGVLAGSFVGLIASFTIGLSSWIEARIDWLWTAPLVCVITFGVAYITSLIIPYQPTPVVPAVPPTLPTDLSMPAPAVARKNG
jgi:Na+/proline symporter